MSFSLSGSSSREVHHFQNSNAHEIVESLRASADSMRGVQELICEESLGDDDLVDLEQFLTDYHRCIDLTNLELVRNGLTAASGPALAQILSLQHETLVGLSLAHNPFSSVGLEKIVGPLLSHSPQATHLVHLDLTDTQLGSKAGPVIAQLLRNNTSLQELNLTRNAIGTKGIKVIAPALPVNSSLLKLNLSYNNIRSLGGTKLANALEENTSVSNLKSLHLTGNSIGHQGMQTLARMLTVNRTLQEFYAGINNIGPEGGAHLAFAIRRNYTLRCLHLNDNKMGPDAASLLFDHLRDDNRTLESLNVAGNGIGRRGAMDLAEVIAQNSVLREVDLSGNGIGSDGVLAVMEALSYNLSLVKLNLNHNNVDDRGAKAIGEFLSNPAPKTLQSISWEDNPGITEEGLIPLARAGQIKRNREHWLDKLLQDLRQDKIHSINWTKRKVGNEEVLLLNEALKDPILQANPPMIRSLWLSGQYVTSRSLVPLFGTPSNVVRLYIHNCNAGDESADAIGKALPRSKSLEVLSLTACGISSKGVASIARGLEWNTTLRRLNLDDNQLGDDGLLDLASCLPHFSLTSLSANANAISDASMKSKGLSQVDELHLKNNHITDGGALDFARTLMDGGCRLTWLSLQGNRVTKKGGETIRTFLPEAIPGTAIIDY